VGARDGCIAIGKHPFDADATSSPPRAGMATPRHEPSFDDASVPGSVARMSVRYGCTTSTDSGRRTTPVSGYVPKCEAAPPPKVNAMLENATA
jgi:hypothetical protein